MTVESFLSALKKSDLLTPEQFAQAQEAARYLGDAEDLARVLARADLITLWQAGQLLAGRTSFLLGKYKLIKLLGRGGMGSVFLARHVAMNRQVALKIVSKRVGHDPASMERFFSEARAAAALDHPNIVRAYDVDSEGDRFFIVMEYVEGRDLQAMVEDDGPMDFDRAADHIRQAADGLAHAHSRNLIHCDIKPSNLIVNTQGVVKILDLGVARLEGGKPAADLATTGAKGQVLGSVDFLAPEQAVGTQFDKRADIYSLGCTLYYLLTGRPPFPEGTLTERILKHQGQAPRSIVSLRSGTPPELVSICRTMMAKAPADRYQSAEEVSWVLQDWRSAETLPRAQPLEDEPAPKAQAAQAPLPKMPEEAAWKPAMAPVTRVQPPPKKKDSASLWPILVGGGAAGVLVALLLFLMLRAMQEPKPVRPKPSLPQHTAMAPIATQSQKPTAPAPEPKTSASAEAPKTTAQPPTVKKESPPAAAPATTPKTTEPETPTTPPVTPSPDVQEPTPPKPQPKATTSTPATPAAKTEFPAAVALPSVPSSGGPPAPPFTLGTVAPDAQASLDLELFGGSGVIRGEQNLILRRADSPDKPHQWKVYAERPAAETAPTPLANISLEGDALRLAWIPDAPDHLAGCLRYCVLLVREDGKTHEVRLGRVEAVNPISVKLSESKATTIDLPLKEMLNPALLRLQIVGLEGPRRERVVAAEQLLAPAGSADVNASGEMWPQILFRVVYLRSGSAVKVSVWFDPNRKGSHLFGPRDVKALERKQALSEKNKQDDAQARHTAALLAVCKDPDSEGRIYYRVFREIDGRQIDLVATPPLPPVNEPSTN